MRISVTATLPTPPPISALAPEFTKRVILEPLPKVFLRKPFICVPLSKSRSQTTTDGLVGQCVY